jgi:hypothetical protein
MFTTPWMSPRVLPPPLWMVTNGDVTVGPVPTRVVCSGYADGLVSPRFYVKDTLGTSWRPVTSLREIRQGAPPPRLKSTSEVLLGMSESVTDVLSLGLDVAIERTGCSDGLIHRFDAGRKRGVITRDERFFDAKLPNTDLFGALAHAKRIALAAPRSDVDARAVSSRLVGDADALLGVAMVPIVLRGRLTATFELGRIDHGFRSSDARALSEVARLVVDRLHVIA